MVKQHNSKVFSEWEKLANKGKAKGICTIAYNDKKELQAIGLDGLPTEKLAEILEEAAKVIRGTAKRK